MRVNTVFTDQTQAGQTQPRSTSTRPGKGLNITGSINTQHEMKKLQVEEDN